MIEKKDVIQFFDEMAPAWDAQEIKNEKVVQKILDNAGVVEGCSVLDVACGTGILFGDYEKRNVASVTGIDISPEMVRLAREKIAQKKYGNVKVICGDVENEKFENKFDVVMVYNAFPHFPEPEKLIESLSRLVKAGGVLSIAHGMSRKAIDAHHSGCAQKVSIGLMDEKRLKKILEPFFDVNVVISDESMYQVCGKKKS